jgi:hypothetical protein
MNLSGARRAATVVTDEILESEIARRQDHSLECKADCLCNMYSVLSTDSESDSD